MATPQQQPSMPGLSGQGPLQAFGNMQRALRDADKRLRDEHETVARLAAYERELEVKLAAAAADLDAQRDYSAQLADRCQVAERRAAEAALALSKSIAEQDLLIKRYARQGAGAAAKAVSPLGAFNE